MKDIVFLGGVAFDKLNLFDRKIGDVDLLGSYDDLCEYIKEFNPTVFYPTQGGKKIVAKSEKHIIDAEVTWDNSTSLALMNLIKNDPKTIVQEGKYTFYFPSLNVQYMLKMSHRYLKNSPHFLKILQDIEMMRYFGAEIEPEHVEFYKARMKETYNYSHPKLNTSKTEFFKDTQIYKYSHDEIHKIMARLDKPAYEYYKPVQTEVNVSKEMFFAVDEKIRLYGGLEESLVLALERSQIPNDYKPDPYWSFVKALEKLATSISSGYFREYVYENYYKIKSMYDPNYVEKFKKAVHDGIIIAL